jgi:hypothetical protein
VTSRSAHKSRAAASPISPERSTPSV